MRKLLIPLWLACAAATAGASDLNVTVQTLAGQSTITVGPGEIVDYRVLGQLGDTLNEGLAYFSFDLAFSGGALGQAAAPTSDPMLRFASPLGLNNPAGFGGTVQAGVLRQVGGAQNTINNTFAPKPGGSVLTGVGKGVLPEELARGSLLAPVQPGTYTLSLSNLRANAIRMGETGLNYWRVDEAGAGSISNLTVVVETLSASATSLSLAAGGTVGFQLRAGAAQGLQVFLLLGSGSGSTPGLPIGPGLVLPLNVSDAYFTFTLTYPNTAPLAHSLGLLDSQGKSTASFSLPPGLGSLAGIVASHAYATVLPIDFVSNPVSISLVP